MTEHFLSLSWSFVLAQKVIFQTIWKFQSILEYMEKAEDGAF